MQDYRALIVASLMIVVQAGGSLGRGYPPVNAPILIEPASRRAQP
jgi:hypothetical protein